MTDAASTPLLMAGNPGAAVCVGDFCEVPDTLEQAVVVRDPDEDRQ
jgi:hypothetical protein